MPQHPRSPRGIQLAAIADQLRSQGWQVPGLGRHSTKVQCWTLLQMALTRLAQYTGRPAILCANALAVALQHWRLGLRTKPLPQWQNTQGRPLDWTFGPEHIVCPHCGQVVTSLDVDDPKGVTPVDPHGHSQQ